MLRAIVVDGDGASPRLAQLQDDELPDHGDVVIKVDYSSLNYKDGLALTGNGRVLRSFPIVPGIDLAGTVRETGSPDVAVGDQVLVTGCGIGESFWGGFCTLARVKSEWTVPTPRGWSSRDAMLAGTAGFTAMLAVMALEHEGVEPASGDIVVTGASGGVGSVAVAILSRLGYRVIASTGRMEESDYLQHLGASEVIHRDVLSSPGKPLDTATWAGAIDSVGGNTLAGILRSVKPWGCVASCGLAGGADLVTSVLPFILRGVSLIGIHSVETPMDRRRAAWRRLETEMPLDRLQTAMQVHPLEALLTLGPEVLAGRVRGRAVIDVNA